MRIGKYHGLKNNIIFVYKTLANFTICAYTYTFSTISDQFLILFIIFILINISTQENSF